METEAADAAEQEADTKSESDPNPNPNTNDTAEGTRADGTNGTNGSSSGGENALSQARTAAERYFDPDTIDILRFELKHHKPLGCTAEQSLVEEEDGSKHVFVSRVKAGGNAHGAGMREGDVVIGATGSFDDVVIVAGLGLEDGV